MSKHKKHITFGRAIAACLLVVGVVAASLVARPATAACSVPATNYGSASMQFSVGTAGDYRIWTRMSAPDTTNNSVLLEVDGGSCYVVGDSASMPANAWTWVNYQNGSTASKIVASLSAGTHTVKLIGREPSVKVDRVLAVADQNCTPSGFGENCMATADTTKPNVTITEPTDGSTVTGTATIKANATDNTSVNRVEFYIQDKLVATDTTSPYSYTWDTTATANQTYTISAKAYDAAGNSSTDSQSVTVKNGDSQPPTAPSGLTASAPAYNKVSLSWKASTDNTGIANYRVVRDGTVIGTTTATAYTDSTVAAGTKYTYTVIAVDNSNNPSVVSNAASVTTPMPTTADTQAPSKPTDLSVTAVSASQINVAWKASTDNIGVKEYDLYRIAETGTKIKLATTTKTSYGDGSVYDDTDYTYYVIARDAAGNSSQASDQAMTRTPKLPSDDNESLSTLRGTVQGSFGRPLEGVKVTIWVDGKRHQATTNWRGRYILTDIPSGRYEVSFRASGYERDSTTVRLDPGKTKWQDMTLQRD